jgi:hypothetical protein
LKRPCFRRCAQAYQNLLFLQLRLGSRTKQIPIPKTPEKP